MSRPGAAVNRVNWCKRHANYDAKRDLGFVLTSIADDPYELCRTDSNGRNAAFVAATSPLLKDMFCALVRLDAPIARDRQGASAFAIVATQLATASWLDWKRLQGLLNLLDPLRSDGCYGIEIDGRKCAGLMDRWSSIGVAPPMSICAVFLVTLLAGVVHDRAHLAPYGYALEMLQELEALHPDFDTACRAIAIAMDVEEGPGLARLRLPTRYCAPSHAAVSSFFQQFKLPPPCSAAAYAATSNARAALLSLPQRYATLPREQRKTIFILFCAGHRLRMNPKRGSMPNELYVIVADLYAPVRRPNRLPVFNPWIGVETLDFSVVTKPLLLHVIRHHCTGYLHDALVEGFKLRNALLPTLRSWRLEEMVCARIFVYMLTRQDIDFCLLKPGLLDLAHVAVQGQLPAFHARGDFLPVITVAESKATAQMAPSAVLKNAVYPASCPYTPALTRFLADIWRNVHRRDVCVGPEFEIDYDADWAATSTTAHDFATINSRVRKQAIELKIIESK